MVMPRHHKSSTPTSRRQRGGKPLQQRVTTESCGTSGGRPASKTIPNLLTQLTRETFGRCFVHRSAGFSVPASLLSHKDPSRTLSWIHRRFVFKLRALPIPERRQIHVAALLSVNLDMQLFATVIRDAL